MSAVVERDPDLSRYKPRRGRPSREQVIALEDSLLSVARELFLEQGYAATSMEGVAATLGVSKPTLYSRFSTKADLFDAIVNDRLRVWETDRSEIVVADAMSLAERLHRYGSAFLTGIQQPERLAFHQLIKAEAVRFPELAAKFYAEGFNIAVGELAIILQSANANGWPLKNPRGVANAFLSGLLGWFDVALMQQTVTDQACRDAVAHLTEIYVGGRAAW